MTPPPSTPFPFTTCVLLAGLTGMPSASVLYFFCPLSMHVLCVPLFSWWHLLSFALPCMLCHVTHAGRFDREVK